MTPLDPSFGPMFRPHDWLTAADLTDWQRVPLFAAARHYHALHRLYGVADGLIVRIDKNKVKANTRYNSKWVLRTNTDYEPAEVALAYKQLWMVEDLFRSMKSLLAIRPIFHRRDETIRGHVFCSFLALLLRTELEDRLAARGYGDLEWAHVIRDLDRLEEIELDKDGKRFVLRTEAAGLSGKVFQAVGVALPPTVQQGE